MNEYICPKCGKKTMVKQKKSNGIYILICQVCGFKRGTLSKDLKRGVV
jgi:transcription elongation factor Elf1